KDIIMGECDRHPKNYFINEKGEVIGIDEDCCLGKNAIPEDVDVRKQIGLVPNKGSLMLRMPGVITQEIYDNIQNLDLKKLADELKPYVSQEEIDATLVRVKNLKEHVEDRNKCLLVNNIKE